VLLSFRLGCNDAIVGNQMAGKNENYRPRPLGFRDRLLETLFNNIGKLLFTATVIILGTIALVRCEPKQIPEVLDSIFSNRIFSWAGWIVAVLVLVAAIVICKMKDEMHDREMDRVVKERDKLQEAAIGHVEHSVSSTEDLGGEQ
jgi:hypothetical protein